MMCLLVVVLAIGFTSCDDDAAMIEEILYTVIFENDLSTNIDIYVDDLRDSNGFKNKGLVLAGSSRTVSDMVVGVDYILRAVIAGEFVDDYFLEQAFDNDDKNVTTLTITISD